MTAGYWPFPIPKPPDLEVFLNHPTSAKGATTEMTFFPSNWPKPTSAQLNESDRNPLDTSDYVVGEDVTHLVERHPINRMPLADAEAIDRLQRRLTLYHRALDVCVAADAFYDPEHVPAELRAPLARLAEAVKGYPES